MNGRFTHCSQRFFKYFFGSDSLSDSVVKSEIRLKSKLTVFEFIGEQHIEFVVYAFFYDNYRFFDLDPKSLFVWTAAMLGTDHGYL